MAGSKLNSVEGTVPESNRFQVLFGIYRTFLELNHLKQIQVCKYFGVFKDKHWNLNPIAEKAQKFCGFSYLKGLLCSIANDWAFVGRYPKLVFIIQMTIIKPGFRTGSVLTIQPTFKVVGFWSAHNKLLIPCLAHGQFQAVIEVFPNF